MTTFDALKQNISVELKERCHAHRAVPGSENTLQRIELQVQEADLILWLKNQNFPQKTYWSERDGRLKMAGVGAAHIFQGNTNEYTEVFEELDRLLKGADEDVRYYGGLKFDPDHAVSELWQRFKRYYFIVPRFELLKRDLHYYFALNYVVDLEEPQLDEILADLQKLDFSFYKDTKELPAYTDLAMDPIKSTWDRNVQQALTLIENGTLQKIVLSGRSTLTFDETINPSLLFEKLIGQNSNSFHFCIQPDAETAFMGITPERLYRREGREIWSEAIAGTRPRGRDEAEDEALEKDLQSSDKDIREHRWVSDMVRSGLGPLCRYINDVDRERILKLRHVQHLQSLFIGVLRDGICDGEIISHLHPTPAVGGFPNTISIPYISEIEGFDRGWYAGPIGWVSRDAAGFAVGIRSGLVNGNKLTIFAGSGIVEGSDPDKEWEENQTKILNFTKLFQ